MIAMKREVMEALLSDSVWSKKLEEAKTMEEVNELLVAFAEEKGFKVKRVKLK